MFEAGHPFANIDSAEPFGLDLLGRPQRRYKLAYLDPNWDYSNYSELGEDRNPKRYYDCMPIEDIWALPICDVLDDNALVALWVRDPMLDLGLETIRRWNLVFVTVLFTWIKLNKRVGKRRVVDLDRDVFMSTGHYTRKNPEMVLLAKRGDGMPRASANVRQTIFAPLRQNSEKPDEVRQGLEKLFPQTPRIEMFARHRRPGWDAWGHEVGKLDDGGKAVKRPIIRPEPDLPIIDAITRKAA